MPSLPFNQNCQLWGWQPTPGPVPQQGSCTSQFKHDCHNDTQNAAKLHQISFLFFYCGVVAPKMMTIVYPCFVITRWCTIFLHFCSIASVIVPICDFGIIVWSTSKAMCIFILINDTGPNSRTLTWQWLNTTPYNASNTQESRKEARLNLRWVTWEPKIHFCAGHKVRKTYNIDHVTPLCASSVQRGRERTQIHTLRVSLYFFHIYHLLVTMPKSSKRQHWKRETFCLSFKWFWTISWHDSTSHFKPSGHVQVTDNTEFQKTWFYFLSCSFELFCILLHPFCHFSKAVLKNSIIMSVSTVSGVV